MRRLAATLTAHGGGWGPGTRLASSTWQVDRVITEILSWGIRYDHVRVTKLGAAEALNRGNVMKGLPGDVKKVGFWILHAPTGQAQSDRALLPPFRADCVCRVHQDGTLECRGCGPCAAARLRAMEAAK